MKNIIPIIFLFVGVTALFAHDLIMIQGKGQYKKEADYYKGLVENRQFRNIVGSVGQYRQGKPLPIKVSFCGDTLTKESKKLLKQFNYEWMKDGGCYLVTQKDSI